jgi:hypothetical protein
VKPARFVALAAFTLALALPAPAAQALLIDDFQDAARWRAAASDQVQAALRRDADGALCLDYDFAGVSGYAFIRRELALPLPAHYAFELRLRGSGPPNDLQIKFTDASGDNVWWNNRQRYTLPGRSTTLRIRQRQIEFAWGPAQDRALRSAAAIEFVIAASLVGGGKGTLCLERLELLELPAPPASPPPVRVRASAGRDAAAVLDARADTAWEAPPWRQTLSFDFGAPRELGGLLLHWQAGAHASDYDLQASDDAHRWRTLKRVRGSRGGADALFVPETETRHLRLVLRRPAGARYGLAGVEVRDPAQWPGIDAVFKSLAALAPRGRYPRAYLSEQNYWTLVGVDGGAAHSALISEDGAIELDRGGASVEPFVRLADGRVVTWADVEIAHSLRDGYLPLPSVRWSHPAFTLEVETAAEAQHDRSTLLARYTLANRTEHELRVELMLALRPFQVNPPQQFLSTPGGTSPVRRLEWRAGVLRLDGRLALRPSTRPDRVIASPHAAGGVLDAGTPLSRLDDPDALAEAALVHTIVLPPRGTHRVAWAAPLGGDTASLSAGDIDARFDAVAAHWRERLNRVQLELPAHAQRVHDTLRSSLAHILMSRAGPALQPGTRSYARSWIRDGAMMEAGLLRLGEVAAVREYLDWFAPRIFDSGKVPCCIDTRGADPVVENDSHGQFVYAVAEAWRHTRDRAVLERTWPQVEAATRYMEQLRQSERIEANRHGERASWWGLMPKSISHEGYSEKPVHSYWDSFWALRGYKDAVQIASALGREREASEFARWRDEFEAELVASIRTAAALHRIDFIPGAAELGDFDPSSTTIALNPAQADAVLPPALLRRTFERYWDDAVARRDGKREWKDYTPYELRNVGALVRLGHPERAHELLRFFFGDQRPAGWNQWAEVVAREPRHARFLGDMPHAWISSDYIRSVLDLFAYEREADRSIVVAAGVPHDWLDGAGIAVRDLSTPHGRLSYRMRRDAQSVRLDVDAGLAVPEGGIVLTWPGPDAPPPASIDGRPAEWNGRELRIASAPARVAIRLR